MRYAAIGLAAMAASLSISSYTPAHAAEPPIPQRGVVYEAPATQTKCMEVLLINGISSKEIPIKDEGRLPGLVMGFYKISGENQGPHQLSIVNPQFWINGDERFRATYSALLGLEEGQGIQIPCPVYATFAEGIKYITIKRDEVEQSSMRIDITGIKK